jgi:hypothetical protein
VRIVALKLPKWAFLLLSDSITHVMSTEVLTGYQPATARALACAVLVRTKMQKRMMNIYHLVTFKMKQIFGDCENTLFPDVF